MTKKAILQLKGMHCTSCAFNIDGELEDTEGVKESNTNYAKQQTQVEYDPQKISLQKIIDIIHKLDESYQAEVKTTAN
jgi:Cu+-exporting ATPase